MFLTERKIEARIRELSEYRYRDSIKIAEFNFLLDDEAEIASIPPSLVEGTVFKVGDVWIGRDLYVWLSASIKIPQLRSGYKIVGRFDFGDTGDGNNSGFESLLYLNGIPHQGVDTNHKEVFIPQNYADEEVLFTFRLWSGLEGGGAPKDQRHTLRMAEISYLDEAVDDFFYTTWAAYETVKELDINQPDRAMLLNSLDCAFREIDWSKPGSDKFYTSISTASELLKSKLSNIEKHHQVTVQCIGHTHIDVAWLWRLKHTREKCARSFSTVLRLMEQFPDYIFLQTQPQLYEYIKTDYPEIYRQICERVKEGRWEAAGGMWLEADCNLTSGESLVRQILFGTRFLRDEFGVECAYLWLPDVFGYSWALPQILKKSGIDSFMTTKISWNQYNRMPHDTFKWRGMDGTEVLTHFITTPEPVSQPGSWFYTYNGRVTAHSVKGIWDGYRNKEINQELLLSYGYGDGGGGVNREMLELRRRLNEMPGLPHVTTGTAKDYFARLHERVEKTDQYVHTWDGELYLEYHRGTYTSQAYNKRMNRKLELLFREMEFLGVLESVLKADWSLYNQKAMNDGWKIILRNQFHDIIPGSSIREVYEDSKLEYEEAERIGYNAWNGSAKSLAVKKANMFTFFNSSSWKRNDLVEVLVEDSMHAGKWLDQSGKVLRSQRTGNIWIVEACNLPPMGYATVNFVENGDISQEQNAFTILSSGILSPNYAIEWNSMGQIVKIFDVTNHREVLAADDCANILQVFEDKQLAHDAWDIDLYYQEKMNIVKDIQSIEVVETGPLRAVVRFIWKYMDSIIIQDMVLYANSRRIDFKTEVDWHEQQQLLKVAFPVNIRSTEATYDVQFGNVKRPTHWNTSWDYARFETVGQQWADLSERGYGVSLLNDCKYGYDIKNNVIRLSLIKSAIHPDTQADQGYHLFTYSLLPHCGDWLEGNTAVEAWNLNNPVTLTMGMIEIKDLSLISISSKNIMIDAVKKAEDSDEIVIRIHEFSGRRCEAILSSGLNISSWRECDLMERPIGECFNESTVRFDITPYEIKTFLVKINTDVDNLRCC